MLEVIDGFVDAVALLIQEGGVEPAGGVIGIEFFGELKFFGGFEVVA